MFTPLETQSHQIRHPEENPERSIRIGVAGGPEFRDRGLLRVSHFIRGDRRHAVLRAEADIRPNRQDEGDGQGSRRRVRMVKNHRFHS